MTAPHSYQTLQKTGFQKRFSLGVESGPSSSSKETIELEKRDDKTFPNIASFYNGISGIEQKTEKKVAVETCSQSGHTSQAVFNAEQNVYSEVVTDISRSPREATELKKNNLPLEVSNNSDSEFVPQSCKMISILNDSEVNALPLAEMDAPLTSRDAGKPLSALSFNEIQTRCVQSQKLFKENECVNEISISHAAPTVFCTPKLLGNNFPQKKRIFSSCDLQEMSCNFSDEPTTGLQPQKKLKEKYMREMDGSLSPGTAQPLENKDKNVELPDAVQLSLRSPSQLEEGNKTVSAEGSEWYREIILLPENKSDVIVDYVTDSPKQDKLPNQTSSSSAKVLCEIKDSSSIVSSTASPVKFESKETTKVVTLMTYRGKSFQKVYQAFNTTIVQSCSDNVLNVNGIAKPDTNAQAIPYKIWDSQSILSLCEMPRALINQTFQSAEESREINKNGDCESLVEHVVPQQDCNLVKNSELRTIQHAAVQCYDCDCDKGIENNCKADVDENTLSSQTLQSSLGFVVSAQSPELVLSPECTSQPFAWDNSPDRLTISGSTSDNPSKVPHRKQPNEGCGKSATTGPWICTDMISNFSLRNMLKDKCPTESSSPSFAQQDCYAQQDCKIHLDVLESDISRESAGNNKKHEIDIMDNMYEEHVVPGDETTYKHQLTQEISLYATNFNVQNGSTAATEHSCNNPKPSFKWSSLSGSCLNEPGHEFDEANTSVKETLPHVIPISNCTRPRRVGLSKKHSVKHLHSK